MPRVKSQTVMHSPETGHTIHVRVRTSAHASHPLHEANTLDWTVRDADGQLVERRRGMPVPALWHGGDAYRADDLLWACRYIFAGSLYRQGVIPLTGHATDCDSVDYLKGTLARGAYSQRKQAA